MIASVGGLPRNQSRPRMWLWRHFLLRATFSCWTKRSRWSWTNSWRWVWLRSKNRLRFQQHKSGTDRHWTTPLEGHNWERLNRPRLQTTKPITLPFRYDTMFLQSLKQSTNDPVNQVITRSFNQSINRLISYSFSLSISQSINVITPHWFNHAISYYFS